MIHEIYSFIAHHKLFSDGSTIVLGLSGGPDSIFLLHVLASLHHQRKIILIAAHLDHGWRPTSASDAQFCAQEAQRLGIACIIGHLDEFKNTIAWNGSQEELGRKARRLFLQQVAERYSANHIALAHHAQDQQETFFIRLIRGSSIAGLASMRQTNGIYIRPLLATSKADILAYLHAHTISYLTDETNTSCAYLRNRIRTNVLPALHQADSRFDANFARTLGQIQSASDFLQQQAHAALTSISGTHHGVRHLEVSQLCAQHPALLPYILVLWLTEEKAPFTPTDAFFAEIMRFAASPAGGTHAICKSWSLVKKKGWIWIQK